jgi:hypothetical protein
MYTKNTKVPTLMKLGIAMNKVLTCFFKAGIEFILFIGLITLIVLKDLNAVVFIVEKASIKLKILFSTILTR